MKSLTGDDVAISLNIGEGQGLEFKRSVSSSVAREMVAFANAEGGRIVFGIYDRNRVVGQKDGRNFGNGVGGRAPLVVDQNLKVSSVHDPEAGGEVRAGEWFTNKKRALLSEYGVGTVDQAILPVRHNFVRLWGLANRVVVFDEIHAYDAYTGTLLIHLLRWLLALGSSVVLLSATLSPSIRRKLANVVGSDLPEPEVEYPRLSVFCPGKEVHKKHFEADPTRRLKMWVQAIPPDLPGIRTALEEHLANGGMGLALVNTVQRAQDLYCIFPDGEPLEREGQRIGKRLPDGTEVFLFHARFPADRRQKREDQALETFGEGENRTGRKILIATQVAEQSLDLDFDLIEMTSRPSTGRNQ